MGLLNVVVRKSATILELLASENQSLLIRRDSFLVLDLLLHLLDRVTSLNFKSDGLAGQSLHEDLHTTTKAKDQMKSGFLLNVVIRKSATILELLASEDKTLLI